MQDFSEWPLPAKALGMAFATLLLAAIWSVLASAVFVFGTGMIRTHQGVPSYEFWLYLWFYGFRNPVVGFWLKLSAGIATAIPVLFVIARVMRKGVGGTVRELHGRTRWAKRRELQKEFRARFAGLYIGYSGNRAYLRFGGPEHLACYAPTRSGKGVGLVIPNCLLYEATLVCLDVKKENYAATAGARARVGQKVFLFDPLDPEGRTARYNPLTYVRRGTLDAFEDIQRIAQMIFPNVQGDQAFWQDSARSAFVGATAFLAETPELPLTIGEVLRLLTRHDGPTYMLGQIEARRIARRPYTEATVSALSDYLKGSADLVNSIRKTVTSKLSLWFNPRIDAATAGSDFDLRELRHSLHAIYVGVTPDNIARLRPLLALFFQQLVDLTVRTLPQFDPKAKHQVLVLLDEFPLLGPMPVLADAFAFVAGYGMRLMLIMQSKAQLRDPALYGPDKAAAILDNCGAEVIFGTKDLALMKELSERLGYDTVEAHSRSGPRFWRMFRGARLNDTASDQRRALLLPQEIGRLQPHEAIVIRPGMYPVKARRIRYYSDKTFSRLVFPPPEVLAIDIPVRMDQGTVGTLPAAPESTMIASPTQAPASTETKPKAVRTKKGKPAAAAVAPKGQTSGGMAPVPAMRPFQSDGLMASVFGSAVDLSEYGLADGKAKIAEIVDGLPSVASLNRSPGIAAE
jgi:type IV secretion system protein VirD4